MYIYPSLGIPHDVRSFPEVVFAEESRGDPRSRERTGGYGKVDLKDPANTV